MQKLRRTRLALNNIFIFCTAIPSLLLLISSIASNTQQPLNAVLQYLAIGLIITSCCLVGYQYKASHQPTTKFFYFTFLSACTCLLLAKSSQTLATLNMFWLFLLNECAHLGFYLLMSIALMLTPNKTLLTNFTKSKNINRTFPKLFFVFLGFIYLVFLPQQLYPTSPTEINSNTIFYLIIELYLIAEILVKRLSGSSISWRSRYTWLCIGLCNMFFAHLIQALHNHLAATNIWLLFVNALSVNASACLLIAMLPKPIRIQSKVNIFKKITINPLLILMFSLPIYHCVGYSSGLLNNTNRMQELVLAIWLLASFILLTKQNKRYSYNLAQHKHRLQSTTKKLKEQERHIEAQQQLYTEKNIISDINTAILVIDRCGDIKYINPYAEQVFFSQEQQGIQANLDDIISSQCNTQKLLEQYQYHQLADKSPTKFKAEVICKTNSSSNHFEFSIKPANSLVEPLYIITLTEIGHHKLNYANALQVKDNFVANISHEFRTPLTIVQGVLNDIIAQQSALRNNRFINIATRNLTKLITMVDQLLELSQLSHGPKADKHKLNISNQTEDIVSHFEVIAKQQQVSFSYDISTNLFAEVRADALQKIISNLLSNAFKYGGQKVSLSLTSQQDTISLVVTDNGKGLGKQQQKDIFARYYQAKASHSSKSYGVGIGLSLVCELVASHQWQLAIDSQPQQQTRFIITLPICSEPSGNISTPPIQAIATEPTLDLPSLEQGAQLLIIEDNKDMQSYIKQVLSPHFNCSLADDGRTGIEHAIQKVPDIIICDLMLPDIDGFSILQSLKNNHATENIPIIMLTALGDHSAKLEGLGRNADDYLTKPFNKQELIIRIDNLLKNRKRLQQHYASKLALPEQKIVGETPFDIEVPKEHQQKFIDKLNTVLEQHFADYELNISFLADKLAVSERQLQRKIKAVLGITPKEYIKEFRLIKAKLLLKSDTPIGNIALSCGFSSQTYFTRCFKEKYQLTPSNYVKSIKG